VPAGPSGTPRAPGDHSNTMGHAGPGSEVPSSQDVALVTPGTSQESRSVLGHLENLARGGTEVQSQLDKLEKVQEGVRGQGKS
jgi:hypothetical protein